MACSHKHGHGSICGSWLRELLVGVGVEEKLTPNPALAAILKSIPLEKAIFTSGHRPHAQKVLRCLGVEPYFHRIFDITFTHYIPKPNPEPYRQILEFLSMDGENCLMIEDLVSNLKPAKDLGMATVLLGEGGAAADPARDGFVDYCIADILKLPDVLKDLKSI